MHLLTRSKISVLPQEAMCHLVALHCIEEVVGRSNAEWIEYTLLNKVDERGIGVSREKQGHDVVDIIVVLVFFADLGGEVEMGHLLEKLVRCG